MPQSNFGFVCGCFVCVDVLSPTASSFIMVISTTPNNPVPLLIANGHVLKHSHQEDASSSESGQENSQNGEKQGVENDDISSVLEPCIKNNLLASFF